MKIPVLIRIQQDQKKEVEKYLKPTMEDKTSLMELLEELLEQNRSLRKRLGEKDSSHLEKKAQHILDANRTMAGEKTPPAGSVLPAGAEDYSFEVELVEDDEEQLGYPFVLETVEDLLDAWHDGYIRKNDDLALNEQASHSTDPKM